ncbi:MAG: trigger factor [Gammaproteobacteria bacterium]|jgi:trigger factor|nr:trigger factor [Gammaproteobacteria bacterium]MBT4606544.1 trigger factor [Thiotrichales bacterium]MBT3471382.1 trigger factor [Gammaproteobacteria bacterium]MBT4080194.1 trigger factor [Gammaproteobacteria bacterium]MBT4330788.1 trigger factor [Gammaproteobacteria bacterium]
MEVSVETTQGLERAMTITVPAERVEKEVSERLNRLKNTVKINGFRPGKVPMTVVKKRFSTSVRYEVAEELIQATFGEAVNQENLAPAGAPKITPEEIAEGEGLKYTATFEVYPEFEVASFADIKIAKPAVELSDENLDKMIDNLREQQKSWSEVEREAGDGDQVNIDFKGSIDGEEFDRGAAEGVPVTLGSGSMIGGFEEGIIGMKVGEEKSIDVTFPEDYSAEELSGKAAQFEIKVNSISESVLPEVDDEFIEKYGVKEGGLDAFRAQIKENMQRECDQAVTQVAKDQVMDGLYEAHTFDIPSAMIEEEAARMAENMQQQMGAQGQGVPLSSELFKGQAERRVKLGLVLAEVVREHNVQVDPVRVQQQIETMAAGYEKPEEVIEYYNQNPQYLEGVQNLVMEEQVVDLVMKDAAVSDESIGFEELMTKANANRNNA